MKFLIITFAIASLAQLSMAGPILRHKRSDNYDATVEDVIQNIKQFALRGETLFRNTLKDIPTTPAYSKYIEMFEEYFTNLEEQRKAPGNCFQKSFQALQMLGHLATTIEDDVNSPEANEIRKILKTHGGDEFAIELVNYSAKLVNLNVENELEEPTPEDDLKIIPVLSEVC